MRRCSPGAAGKRASECGGCRDGNPATPASRFCHIPWKHAIFDPVFLNQFLIVFARKSAHQGTTVFPIDLNFSDKVHRVHQARSSHDASVPNQTAGRASKGVHQESRPLIISLLEGFIMSSYSNNETPSVPPAASDEAIAVGWDEFALQVCDRQVSEFADWLDDELHELETALEQFVSAKSQLTGRR